MGRVDTGSVDGGDGIEMSAEGEGGGSSREPDSVERFVADLNALRQAEGNLGVKALGRRMDLAHGSVHRALSSPTKLPSVYVLKRMIDYWQPDRSAEWLARRRRLADGELATDGDAERGLTNPGLGSVPEERAVVPARQRPGRQRAARVLAGAAVLGLGVFLATPLPRGGVEVIDYCRTNYPGVVKGPDFTHDESWSGWQCQTPSGRTVPVDMNLACRQQRPPKTPLGRTFADHRGDGPSSWRCYSAIVYLAFNDG